mmetsp:Transcript_1512/g.2115  ORF Transcript_1512/g.2115 Transcript_1512/m.2115 type:complete len:272 (+) Transcript_1512:60-875(+)
MKFSIAIVAAFPFIALNGNGLGGAKAATPTYSDEEHAGHHHALQEHTCATAGGSALSVNAVFSEPINFQCSAHICAEEKSSLVASGKVFSSYPATDYGLPGHVGFLYHAHCIQTNDDGITFLGLEIEEIKGPSADHMYEPDGSRRQLNVPVDASMRKLKSQKQTESKSAKKASGSSTGSPTGSPIDCPVTRRLQKHGHFYDAGQEVTSGNEPIGTLAVFRIEKKSEGKDLIGTQFDTDFLTSCDGFADFVKTLTFDEEDAFKVAEGEIIAY